MVEYGIGKMEEVRCKQVAKLRGGVWDKMIEQSTRVYGADGIAPTLTTCGGGNLEPKVAEPLAYDEQNKYIRQDGTVGTLTTDGSTPKHNNRVIEPKSTNYRIRKLTPLECLRLMGFDDEDYEKVRAIGMSDSQIYKQAGNSIVVNVLEKIFEKTI